MSTIVEQFESALFARAEKVDRFNPYGYTSGYLLAMVKNIVKENSSFEELLKMHITSLENTVAETANSDDEDEIVYFY